MKIKLFYSYSNKDSEFRKNLEDSLVILRNEKIIDEWHDEKIIAGDDWNQEIENNMMTSHIILLLFSPDFIASEACKKEMDMALKLKQEKGVIFIPIILRDCAWKDIDNIANIANIEALPKKAKPITKWDDQDSAWKSVYEGIKSQVEKIKDNFMPVLKDSFKNDLLKTPITDSTLDKLFVYPDILEINKSKQKLEKNEIDSAKLKDITSFAHKYVLIEGGEQSGKTSLCHMLYLHYVDINFYPILLNGNDIAGKADIKNIVNKKYNEQYDLDNEYWSLPKEKRILIIDDINNRKANNQNYSAFLKSIAHKFEYAIILIDELSNLSDKSTEHNYFYPFNDYTIKPLGHQKRDELIKKCIANDDDKEFSLEDSEQVARLDKDTKHIDTIIGSNIFPSYPIFIVSTFHIMESAKSHDMTKTSYGHCYHAMITIQLAGTNVRADDIDTCFNFLTEFSYFIFNTSDKYVSKNELDDFKKWYDNEYGFDEKIFETLLKSNIIVCNNQNYSFKYIYIYYYFVAKYIADNIDDDDVKNQVKKIMSTIHKKDSSNIIVFITHHTKNQSLIGNILDHTMSIFQNFAEATLDKKETKFISDYVPKLEKIALPPKNHNPADTRKKQLKEKDALKPVVDKIENDFENQDDDLLLVEIRKSAKSLEIIGQIMKNQHGTFKKDRLYKLFLEGQNVGLRLLKSFIKIMDDIDLLDNFIQERLAYIAKERKKELSKEEIKKISSKLITRFSYSIIFGWLYKIVDSIGYNKVLLIKIADDVNKKTNTPASNLINFSIHAWHKKNIDIKKLESLYNNFKKDNNQAAIYLLKDIVSRHIYMHKIAYQDKQKIGCLLDFDVQKQVAVQQKIN